MDPSSINETVNLVQRVIKLGKKATNIQYEEALLAAREVIFDLREENLSIKEELNVLNKKLKKQEEVKFSDGVYWFKSDKAKKRPLCPRCYEKESTVITLYLQRGFMPSCPECKNTFDPYLEG